MAGENLKAHILGNFRALQSECQAKINGLTGKTNVELIEWTVVSSIHVRECLKKWKLILCFLSQTDF